MNAGTTDTVPKIASGNYKSNRARDFRDSSNQKPKIEGKDAAMSDSSRSSTRKSFSYKDIDQSGRGKKVIYKSKDSHDEAKSPSKRYDNISTISRPSIVPNSCKGMSNPQRETKSSDIKKLSPIEFSSKSNERHSRSGRFRSEKASILPKATGSSQIQSEDTNKPQFLTKSTLRKSKKPYFYSLEFMRSIKNSPLVKPPNSMDLLPPRRPLDPLPKNGIDKLSEHINKATRAATSRNELHSQNKKNTNGLWRNEGSKRNSIKDGSFDDSKGNFSSNNSNQKDIEESMPEWMDYSPSQYPDDLDQLGYFSSATIQHGAPIQNSPPGFDSSNANLDESSVKSRFLSLFGDKNIQTGVIDFNAVNSSVPTPLKDEGDSTVLDNNVDKLFRMFGSKIQNSSNHTKEFDVERHDELRVLPHDQDVTLNYSGSTDSMVNRLFGLMNIVSPENENFSSFVKEDPVTESDLKERLPNQTLNPQSVYSPISTINEAYRGIVPTSVLRKNIQKSSQKKSSATELNSYQNLPKESTIPMPTSELDSDHKQSTNSNLPDWLLALAVKKTPSSTNSFEGVKSDDSPNLNSEDKNSKTNKQNTKSSPKDKPRDQKSRRNIKSMGVGVSLKPQSENPSITSTPIDESRSQLPDITAPDSNKKLNSVESRSKSHLQLHTSTQLSAESKPNDLEIGNKPFQSHSMDVNDQFLNVKDRNVVLGNSSNSENNSKDDSTNTINSLESTSPAVSNNIGTEAVLEDTIAISDTHSNLNVESVSKGDPHFNDVQENSNSIFMGNGLNPQQMQIPFYPLHNMNLPNDLMPSIYPDQTIIDPILAQHQFMLQNEQLNYLQMGVNQGFAFGQNNPNFVPHLPDNIHQSMRFMAPNNYIPPIPINSYKTETPTGETDGAPSIETKDISNTSNFLSYNDASTNVAAEESHSSHEKSYDINKAEGSAIQNQNLGFGQNMFYHPQNPLQFGNPMYQFNPSTVPMGFHPSDRLFQNNYPLPGIGYFPFQMSPQNSSDVSALNNVGELGNFHSHISDVEPHLDIVKPQDQTSDNFNPNGNSAESTINSSVGKN
ncbi:hypothetical protein AYI68_g5075 [Smittium mucronatum]|uniref:Uncharacterized protein n=1 Tax=Smittium mucronatum TaxID=133383 RepID=A0A1R0GVA4_9FUNG|nr:hypothetical protein AYI68_g5075 [Smittium mucronatum]